MTEIFNLKDTVAIVTGAGNGNGLEIAKGFINNGAVVIGVDVAYSSDIKLGLKIVGDITNIDIVDLIEKSTIQFDSKNLVLVNCAGVTHPVTGSYPIEFWNRTIEVNLTAPFNIIERLTPQFKSVGGSIINITSLAAERAFPDNPAYAAAKGGLKMLTKYYARALGKYGVRVNNVGPGYIKTDMTKGSFKDPVKRINRERQTVLGRWGDPKDLVGVCVFLASTASSYITGQDIYVDGGWLANGLVDY